MAAGSFLREVTYQLPNTPALVRTVTGETCDLGRHIVITVTVSVLPMTKDSVQALTDLFFRISYQKRTQRPWHFLSTLDT